MIGTTGILVAFFVLVLVFMLFMLRLISYQKAHRVRVLYPTHDSFLIEDIRMVSKKDKVDGQVWWHEWSLLGTGKFKFPSPPKSTLYYKKGKGILQATVQRVSNDEVLYLRQEMLKTKFKYEPVQPIERAVLFEQYKRAAEIEASNSFQQLIMNLGFGLFMTVVIVMLMVFWGDLAQPLLQMGDAQTALVNRVAELIQILDANGFIVPENAVNSGVVNVTVIGS